MARLEVRLLGGFEVRLGDQSVTGFESQKVRALLAYLVAHRDQTVSRDRLAALLWAEKSDSSAKRNLRQALHNLRSAFQKVNAEVSVLEVTHKTLRIHPEMTVWLDVKEFDRSIRRGFSTGGADPFQLNIAARLYGGDFLSGFFIKDSQPFEDWLLHEQERSRDAAIEAFRSLISAYMNRGEYRLGIQFARRLLAVDPLSEEAHRYLMRLNALSGRRNRALALYEELRNLLNDELGVEPLEETAELYQSILMQDLPVDVSYEDSDPVGPLIPLVGRGPAFDRLHEIWQEVSDGNGRMTIIEGERGVGKTRLVRSFVDAATTQRGAIVLRGRAFPYSAQISLRPFAEIAFSGLSEFVAEDYDELARKLEIETWVDLIAISPGVRELVHGVEAIRPAFEQEPEPERFVESLVALFDLLSASSMLARELTPVVVLLDDLQHVDRESIALLERLVPAVHNRPIWILAGAEVYPTAEQLAIDARSTVDRIYLSRLEENQLQEIAFSLVGALGAEALGQFLVRWSGGLPLAAAELINYLWDERYIEPAEGGLWELKVDLEAVAEPPESLRELILLRIQRLPTSARRLISIAAIFGQEFDADLIQIADHEHIGVVEICIQLMLERWLIRQFPKSWSDKGRERDVVIWARGVRRGSFEFAHEAIREVILNDINPLRKSIMHREVATALESTYAAHPEAVAEKVAFHLLEGGEWERAVDPLEEAALKVAALGGTETAAWYASRLVKALERVGQKRSIEAEQLEPRKARAAALLERLTAAAASS